jgi:hypothetical protein
MQTITTLLSANPALVSVGTVALALTMLTAMLGTLAYKATQAPRSHN